jgi:hypothetical protein
MYEIYVWQAIEAGVVERDARRSLEGKKGQAKYGSIDGCRLSVFCVSQSEASCCRSFVRNNQNILPEDVYGYAGGVSVFDRILQRMREKVRTLTM